MVYHMGITRTTVIVTPLAFLLLVLQARERHFHGISYKHSGQRHALGRRRVRAGLLAAC
jgi:hypothetical protein